MSKYRIIIQVLFISAIVLAVSLFFLWRYTYPHKISINNKVFFVEIADNPLLMEKGLSGHEPLSNEEAMLFIFKNPGIYGFWMKDMNFAIDIIWFDANQKIVHMEESVSPKTYPKVFSPSKESLYVLETSSGEAKRSGLKIGDTFEFVKNSGRKLEL